MIRTKSVDSEDEKQEFGLPGVYIPAEVLFNEELTLLEKLLFGFISNLSASEKGCWASNNYLGKCLGVGMQSISNGIAKLQKLQYIITEYSIRAYDRKQMRNIWVNPKYTQIYHKIIKDHYKKINRPHINSLYTPPKQIIDPPYKIYTEYNNKIHNNNVKKINKKDFFIGKIISQFSQDWQDNEDLQSALSDYVDHRLQKNASGFTEIAATRLGHKLLQFTIKEVITALNNSVANGWTGVFPESVKNVGGKKKKFDYSAESYSNPENKTTFSRGTRIIT